jgi:hypothetical protein
MHIDWTERAAEELRRLSPTLQRNAHALIGNLEDNPDLGYAYNIVPLSDGDEVQVFLYQGMLLAVEYYRRGWLRKTLCIRAIWER